MKVNTRERNTSHESPVAPERRKHGPLTQKDRESEEFQEFIRVMNEFVDEHGTLTDDDFFKVL